MSRRGYNFKIEGPSGPLATRFSEDSPRVGDLQMIADNEWGIVIGFDTPVRNPLGGTSEVAIVRPCRILS